MDNQRQLELKKEIDRKFASKSASRFLIAIAGPISAGKSTFANELKQLFDDDYRIEIVASDGFLFNNQELEKQKIFDKKGWPESFDNQEFQNFLIKVKQGDNPQYNLYSQVLSDIDIHQKLSIDPNTEIVIVEGINVLADQFADLFDFKIYLDAAEVDLIEWYLKRTLENVDLAKNNPNSWFHQFAGLNDQEVAEIALDVWKKVNQINIEKYIQPTKINADLVIKYQKNHQIYEFTFKKGL